MSLLLTLWPGVDQVLGRLLAPEPQLAHLHKGHVERRIWPVVLPPHQSQEVMLVPEGCLPVLGN